MTSLVSVIVPTRNAARTLRACLASARAQTHQPIELIVVDNASDDASPVIARELADLVLSAGPERSAQRNAGIRAARGEHILMLDADMVPEPGVVAACLDAIDGRGGVAVPEVSFGSGYWARCKAHERACYVDDPLISAARFFRRSELLAAGGYDEALISFEDWDLSMRLCRDGGPAFARARIFHDEGRQTLGGLWRKKYYYGRSMRAFVRKHGRAALARLNPVRPSLLRRALPLLSAPHLAAGVFAIKAVEACGGVVGMVAARRQTVYGDRRAA